ncbi:hypothetical protein MHYP_G00049060 [Metynnis hypsauchen]
MNHGVTKLLDTGILEAPPPPTPVQQNWMADTVLWPACSHHCCAMTRREAEQAASEEFPQLRRRGHASNCMMCGRKESKHIQMSNT